MTEGVIGEAANLVNFCWLTRARSMCNVQADVVITKKPEEKGSEQNLDIVYIIVGASVGGVALLLIIALVVFLSLRKKNDDISV